MTHYSFLWRRHALLCLLLLCMYVTSAHTQTLPWDRTLKALESVKVNGVEILCDTTESWALATIGPIQKMKGAQVEFTLEGFMLSTFFSINGDTLKRGTPIRIQIDPDKEYHIQVIETTSNMGAWSRSIPLHFTTLPLVCLNAQTVSRNYGSAAFRLMSKEQTVSVPTAKIKWRGGSTRVLPKKSFGLKLTNGTEKMDLPLLGMRNDNNWILDAAAIDRSRMRNRVSFELWEDFSARPYQSEMEPMAKTSIRGQYVELFLNNRYEGLYCLSEKIDRKQLKLKKFKNENLRGLLFKATDHIDFGNVKETFDNERAVCNGWTFSYPDLEDGEAIDWEPLSEFYRYISSGETKNIAEQIDEPVWSDFFLLIDLMMGLDNINKNLFAYFYDITSGKGRKLGAAPWDMDATWGRDWKERMLDPCAKVGNSNKLHIALQRLHNNSYYYAQRYAEMRNSHFCADSLKERFHRYFDLFAESGAAQRETQRWSEGGGDDVLQMPQLDFDDERRYIDEWIDKRLEFLDNLFSINTDITQHYNDDHSTRNETRIYDLSGKPLKSKPERGFYIQNGKKWLK
ncbi:MAG: CotH kinase family protein [Bacteroidaceae bacterium]|nr:CotH kinase family protein [Bacteroidaceae bacterium]